MDFEFLAAAIGAAVMLASIAANFFPPYTLAARALHWFALNGPGLQRAARELAKPNVPADPVKLPDHVGTSVKSSLKR